MICIKKKKKSSYYIFYSPEDRMLHEGLKRILVAIFTSQFSKYAFSSVLNQNVHFALRQVKNWRDIFWLVNLDIETNFDKTNKKKLLNILKLKIHDQRFFDILNKFFKSKTLDLKVKTTSASENDLPKNVLTLILLQIYFNEFDKFVENLMLQNNIGKERQRNKEYRNATEWRKFTNRTVSERNRVLKNLRKHKINYTNLKDPNYKKIRYVRYETDFLMGIAGDKTFAREIIFEIKVFLRTQLHLNILEKKHNLTSIVFRQTAYLGFLLKKAPKHLNPVISQNLKGKEKRARVLKRLKYALILKEQQELKKIKNHLKRAITKSLSKNQKYKNVDSDLLDKVSQIVSNERKNNPFFEKSLFSDSTLKTIMISNKSYIPKDILEKFTLLQEAIDLNSKNTNYEIHLAKTTGKCIDDKGKEQKIITKQIDLPVQIYCPTISIKKSLKERGLITKKGKPRAFDLLLKEDDLIILKWFAVLAWSFLTFYSCADNFYKVKTIINYHIKWALFHTIAKKHKMNLTKLFKLYGQEFEKKDDLKEIFPSKSDVASFKKGFSTKDSLNKPQTILSQPYLMKTKLPTNCKCSVENCSNTDIEMHHTSPLKTHTGVNEFSILTRKGKRITGFKAHEISKNRKQKPYCTKHHKMLHAGLLIFKNKKIFDPNLK